MTKPVFETLDSDLMKSYYDSDENMFIHGQDVKITSAQGDTILIIEADPTNTNDNATPQIVFRADGSTGTSGFIGMAGGNDNFAPGVISNAMVLRTTGTRAQQFVTGSGPSMTITSDKNVGIGTTAPQSKLDLYGTSSPPTHLGHIRVSGGAANAKGGIELVNTAFGSGYGWRVDAPDEGGGSTPLVFRSRSNSAAWTESVRMLSQIQGGGIAFNGDTAAANALDDYEEGTWTPNLSYNGGSAGQVMVSAHGTYTKIGRVVHCNFIVSQSTKGTSTGAVGVSLPFAVSNLLNSTVIEASGSIGYISGIDGNAGSVGVTAMQGSGAKFYRTDILNQLNTSIVSDDINDAFQCRVSLTYFAT